MLVVINKSKLSLCKVKDTIKESLGDCDINIISKESLEVIGIDNRYYDGLYYFTGSMFTKVD